jgi:hypothetical protein
MLATNRWSLASLQCHAGPAAPPEHDRDGKGKLRAVPSTVPTT